MTVNFRLNNTPLHMHAVRIITIVSNLLPRQRQRSHGGEKSKGLKHDCLRVIKKVCTEPSGLKKQEASAKTPTHHLCVPRADSTPISNCG